MQSLLCFGSGSLFDLEFRSGRHAPSSRLGNLRPHSLVGAKHLGHRVVITGHGIPAPEGNRGIIVGSTLREVHIPAVRVSHQVPAAIQAIKFPHDFTILGAGRFANHQRLTFGSSVPEAASSIGIFASKGAVLPVITHRVLFIPPVQGSVIGLKVALIESGQRNHLPATRSGLDFGFNLKATLIHVMSYLVAHRQSHFELADRGRSHFPLTTIHHRARNILIRNRAVFAHHQHMGDCRFTGVFGTEGQQDCIAGLFNFRFHNPDFATFAAGARFRIGVRNDGTRGLRNDAAKGYLDGAGRFRELFVGSHHIKVPDNLVEFAVPPRKGVAFAYRVCRRHGSRAVFHHLNVANLGFVKIQEGNFVQHLSRIVNGLIDNITVDLGHLRCPARKGIDVFFRRCTSNSSRRQYNSIIFHRILGKNSPVKVFKHNPVLLRSVSRLDIQVFLDIQI